MIILNKKVVPKPLLRIRHATLTVTLSLTSRAMATVAAALVRLISARGADKAVREAGNIGRAVRASRAWTAGHSTAFSCIDITVPPRGALQTKRHVVRTGDVVVSASAAILQSRTKIGRTKMNKERPKFKSKKRGGEKCVQIV